MKQYCTLIFHRTYVCLFVFFVLNIFNSSAYATTSIPLTINMSESVTVTGTPRIVTDIGGISRYANYASGTGTSALTFTCDTIAGDIDLDGITLSSPVDLNGGTIKDLNGNDATLTFTIPDTSNVRVNYPSLGMNFLTNRYTVNGTAYTTLPSFLTAVSGTFTRGSIGSYFDSSGVLQTAASGVLRFDHDPLTNAPKGLLIEESRRNFYISSETLPTATNGGPTLTSNIDVAPDGTMTADRVAAPVTSSGVYGTPASAPLTAGTQYTISTFVKYVSGNTRIRFGVPNSFTNNTGDWLTAFDFSNNTFSLTNANLSNVRFQDVGNGWIRLSVTATVPAGGTGGGPLIYAHSGATTFLAWGHQIEQGAFPTSYIRTTGVTVTRAADLLTIPAGAWFSTTEGTVSAQSGQPPNSTSLMRFAHISDGTINNRIILQKNTATGFRLLSIIGGVTVASPTRTSALSGSLIKTAGAYKLNDYGLSVDGSTASTATGAIPPLNTITIGSGTTDWINTTMTQFNYYPSRASNAQLQLLTQ